MGYVNKWKYSVLSISVVIILFVSTVILTTLWPQSLLQGKILTYNILYYIFLLVWFLSFKRFVLSKNICLVITFGLVAGYLSGMISNLLAELILPNGIGLVINSIEKFGLNAFVAIFLIPLQLGSWLFGFISALVLNLLNKKATEDRG